MDNTTPPVWIDNASKLLNKWTHGTVVLEFCNSNMGNNATEDYAFFTVGTAQNQATSAVTIMGGSALYRYNWIKPLSDFLNIHNLDIQFTVINGTLGVILTRDCEIYNAELFDTLMAIRMTKESIATLSAESHEVEN